MPAQTVPSFPAVRLPSHCGGLPVEVALIAQLGIGEGNALIAGVSARQRAHSAFIDALDEPSARIAGMDLDKGDATSLYTFAVGSHGHPFHRHAGHRVFTAVSGSAGARLRFSTASEAQVAEDPHAFVAALRHVVIPPDCLFTVRFGGGTWHQFVPLHPGTGHPAMFALSCHTNELGGELAADVRDRVAANAADIPSLTEVLPSDLLALVEAATPTSIPTFALALDAAPDSLMSRACAVTRRAVGGLRRGWARLRPSHGFLAQGGPSRVVVEDAAPPAGSLLRAQLAAVVAHEDSFTATLPANELRGRDAPALLADVLEGFLENRPVGVGSLMRLRNVLVAPMRLRTSPLACPVSSLLNPEAPSRFAARFPVLDQRIDGVLRAQVVLGADDKHLRFRSCVDVACLADGRATVTLGTRVQPTNAFGRVYLAAIDRVHRRYVTPAMLRAAIAHAVRDDGTP